MGLVRLNILRVEILKKRREKMNNVSVYIIESPSDRDIFNGQYEGRTLTDALQIAKIHFDYYLTVSKQTFVEAIANMKEIIQEGIYPLLHLSTHGNQDGIELTDKTFIKWDELKKYLEPINNSLNQNLCFGISSCSGFMACKMAMNYSMRLPFFALVGPTKEIPINDVTKAFVTFYFNLLKKKSSGKDAVEAMKIASHNENFDIALAEEKRDLWKQFELIKVLKQLNLQK